MPPYLDYWKYNFTIHGLWPQYNETDGYPSYCDITEFDPAQLPSQTTMLERWPNVQATNPNSTDYTDFWKHEWDKHGTCSGLTQYDYFDVALNMTYMLPTPSTTVYPNTKASSIDIRNEMGGSSYVSLQCDKNTNVLTGVYTCWEQQNNVPTQQVECNAEVLSEDTCDDMKEVVILSL